MLRALKDAAVSLAASTALSVKLRGVCDMLNLRIDSASKTLIVEAMPKGEVAPLFLELRGYSLETTPEGRTVLAWQELVVSREWLAVLAGTLLPQNRLELPEGAPVELVRAFV